MIRKSLLASALLAGIIAGGEASAADTVTVPLQHNGSTMEARLTGKIMQLVYAKPKASLVEAGVKPGDVLAELFWRGKGEWKGEARVFKSGCTPAVYDIRGTNFGDVLVLDAPQGPVWVKGSVEWDKCRYRIGPDSKHLSLEFRASAAEIARLDPETTEARQAAKVGTLEEAEDQQDRERKELAAKREVFEALQAAEQRAQAAEARAVDAEAAAEHLRSVVAELEARAVRAEEMARNATVSPSPAPVAAAVERIEQAPPAPVAEITPQPEPVETNVAKSEPVDTPPVEVEAKPAPSKLAIDF